MHSRDDIAAAIETRNNTSATNSTLVLHKYKGWRMYTHHDERKGIFLISENEKIEGFKVGKLLQSAQQANIVELLPVLMNHNRNLVCR